MVKMGPLIVYVLANFCQIQSHKFITRYSVNASCSYKVQEILFVYIIIAY